MKDFVKIFLITLAIQLGGIVLGLLLSNLGSCSDTLNRLGTIIMFGCVSVAVIVDIILAIRWGTNIKNKLIYISHAYELSLDSICTLGILVSGLI